METSFRLGHDGAYRCDAFQEFVWQRHGFGTRLANPEVQVTLRQIHSNRVVNAYKIHDREREGDALVTDETRLSIGIRTADCVPILLLDRKEHAVAAVHAGWRGTVAEIVKRAIEQLRIDFHSMPENLFAAIGPCIGSCCYTVGAEVAKQFAPLFPEWGEAVGEGQSAIDLAGANKRQMQAAGIPSEHIFDCALCTSCFADHFFSYRREPHNPGRMVSSICRLD